MGNEALTLPTIQVQAQPMCTSASTDAPAVASETNQEATQSSVNFSPAPAPVSSSPLQSLLKRVQLFSSAKDVFGPDGSEAVPLETCSYVTMSGNGYFGDVEVGRSETRNFSISNPCACPVTVYLSGGGSGFSLNNSSITISGHGSGSFSVTFRPTSDTSYSGSVSSNPSGSVSLSGRGTIRR